METIFAKIMGWRDYVACELLIELMGYSLEQKQDLEFSMCLGQCSSPIGESFATSSQYASFAKADRELCGG